MSVYLVFRLSAALASAGGLATQSRRDSERYPGRSAVLGLVGAALGVDRSDRAKQEHLHSGYDVAVHIPNSGVSLRDYHTVQTIPSASAKRPDSRLHAFELAEANGGKINTILTNREYREGMYAEVALQSRDGAHWTFDEIENALRHPKYILFFGRKSCPLTSPVHPTQIAAGDIFEAFAMYGDLEAHAASPERCMTPGTTVMDNALLCETDRPVVVQRKWDISVDRERWHFSERDAYVVSPRGA